MSTQIDTKNRIIYISGDINENSMGTASYEVLKMLTEDQEKENKEKDFERLPIKIYLHTPGGYVSDMWSFVNILINSKTPIYTYCAGYAYSCGFYIFIAGHKRFMAKNAELMYHQYSGGACGTYQKLCETRERQDYVYSKMEEFVLQRTEIEKEKLDELKTKKIDWYVYADEALKLGVATDIMKEL